MVNGVRGARNAREVIPWLVGRQALCGSSAWIQWGLYRGANQPCPTIACLIKGQERRALSANDWGENKMHPVFYWRGCEKAFSVQIFFPESRRIFFIKKVNVSPCVCVEGYRGSRRRGSASSRKVNIRRGDVFRHSGLRKHVSTDTTHAKQLKHAQPGLHLQEPRLTYSSHGYTCDGA